MSEPIAVLTCLEPPPSLAPAPETESRKVRIGAVQQRWNPDPELHRRALAKGIAIAAHHGAELVCLQELTLSPYFAQSPDGARALGVTAEQLPGGPTFEFAAELARETGVCIHASLYEREDSAPDRGYNTAIVVSPGGELLARTRKLHIPVTKGYHENLYFASGPAGPDAFPVAAIGRARAGFPTCWDQWFPEVARAYALAGAELVIYPTAIGSEPEHPDFDTEPLWERVMIAGGIANGLFVVAVNRIGTEEELTFYGSSFISDPYGRKLAQAPRNRPAVLVAELELGHRSDWLRLFPLLETRRPDAYGVLTAPAA